MAIAFGIFAIIFGFLAPMSAGSGGENDAKAAPYCFAIAIVFAIASVAYGSLVH